LNGPFFQFDWAHICSGVGLVKKSSIINHQSSMVHGCWSAVAAAWGDAGWSLPALVSRSARK
jgi:hypothetical protein